MHWWGLISYVSKGIYPPSLLPGLIRKSLIWKRCIIHRLPLIPLCIRIKLQVWVCKYTLWSSLPWLLLCSLHCLACWLTCSFVDGLQSGQQRVVVYLMISQKPFKEIIDLCRKYSCSKSKAGKRIRAIKSVGGGVTRTKLGNLLENFKTYILGTLSS